MFRFKLKTHFPILFAGLIFFQSDFTSAYFRSVHFYSTLTLSRYCGLDEQTAIEIAWANQRVDESPSTSSGIPPKDWLKLKKIKDRKLFHFPVNEGETQVREGSESSQQILNFALSEARRNAANPVLFGIGLHVFQDSWSHAGYAPLFGHIWTQDPDFTHKDVTAADQMIQETFNKIDLWRRAAHSKGCDSDPSGLFEIIRIWNRHSSKGIKDSELYWRSAAETLLEKTIPMKSNQYEKWWEENFLTSVKMIRNNF